ncbi:hypothetical protein [Paenibacillus planticolens]|nr:hypothetical protein [Paenibacillus planticolens]
MRKNMIIVSVCVVIILSISVFMYDMKDNPNSMKNRLSKETLSHFYDVYAKGMDGVSEFMKNNNAGSLANYRFYYGEILGYQIEKIKDLDPLHKEAKVKVQVKDKQKAYTDFITLELINNKWLISSYSSSSKEGWPTLP